ncbi:hypothetical protein NC652_021359 [Populus alba x Populus x berolinensis]|nr:hypothetical protein NC652_021359 [Populus alba x Populus x berolinensis]
MNSWAHGEGILFLFKNDIPKMEQIAMIWRETMRETFVDEMIWLKAFLGLLRPLFTFNNNRVLLTLLFLFLLFNLPVPNSHTLTCNAPAPSIRFIVRNGI